MEAILLIIISLLLLIIFALMIRTFYLRKSVKEINEEFRNRLAVDTNNLISVSSRDPHLLKLANDINVQLKLLRKERQKFQQGDQELKEAISNLSHDLRTPLTAISGYLDLLDREEKNENIQRYISCIRNRTEALKTLTEELFCFSVAGSVQELNLERIDLVMVLEENLVSFYGAMKERNIEPEIELPDEKVYRLLDQEALNRIFSNIISNALKYSDGDFAVKMSKDGTIVFSNSADNLDTVAVGRLFNRFYTVEASRNSTGLGLSIAKTLMERMGGSIGAEYHDNRLFITLSFK